MDAVHPTVPASHVLLVVVGEVLVTVSVSSEEVGSQAPRFKARQAMSA